MASKRTLLLISDDDGVVSIISDLENYAVTIDADWHYAPSDHKQYNVIVVDVAYFDATDSKQMKKIKLASHDVILIVDADTVDTFADDTLASDVWLKPLHPILTVKHLLSIEQKYEALYEQIGFILHTIHTDMSLIKLTPELLLRIVDSELTEKQNMHLHRIKTSAEHVYSFIRTLHDLSKFSTHTDVYFNLEKHHIKTLIQERLPQFREECVSQNQTLTVNIPSDLPLIVADEFYVLFVLEKIVANAQQYTADNGKINIVAKHKDNMVEVSVIDNGMGISDDDLEKIFVVPYFRSDQARYHYRGLGLNLVICRYMINAMGGQIAVKSELDIGTIVTFTLSIAVDRSN